MRGCGDGGGVRGWVGWWGMREGANGGREGLEGCERGKEGGNRSKDLCD